MKKFLFLLGWVISSLTLVNAQTIQVTGVVTSTDDGMALPGVSVVIKGTNKGTMTDNNGSFTISAQKSQTLAFSFIGYNPVEILITTDAPVNVSLEPAIQNMDEVIVVAYGTAQKSSYTGSAQKINSEKLATTTSESIDKALAGKATGVRITSLTGDPGASGDIQIRGIGSISGSTAPLYIVDGVPIVTGNYGSVQMSSNVLSSINPQDIESMTVLKDAAAASLYGSRAANGVVIINTKKGSQGKTKFFLKANYGVSSVATDSYMLMTGPQYIEYERAALEGFYLLYENALVPGSANFGNETIIQEAKDWAASAQYEGWGTVDDPDVSTDWRSAIYGTGSDQDYQVSASGGNEKSNFYMGLGYKDVVGIVKMNTFKRYSGTFNISNKAREWLDISFNNMLSYSDQVGRGDQTNQAQGIATASPLGLMLSGNPTSRIYNEDGSFNMNASFDSRVKNPLYSIQPDQSLQNFKTYRLLSNASVTVRFTDFLSFKTTNAIDYSDVEGFQRWSPTSIDGASLNGLGVRRSSHTSQMTSSNLLIFNKKFGLHSINATGGFETQLFRNIFLYSSATNYSTDKLEELVVGQPDDAQSYKDGKYLQSGLANINYNYDDRYYLAGSIRMDESSQLGLNRRKATFYSASFSWRFAKEDFLSTDWLNDGKLRFSYGTNGNLPDDFYGHQGLYFFGGAYGAESAIWLSQPENLNLGWEMSHNMNIGIDITAFNRFSMSIEYFRKYTKDLLLDVPTSYVTGFTTALQNKGEISNKGVEVEIHLADILQSAFKWNLDFSLSTLKSTVEKLPDGDDIITGDGNHYIYREGGDLYTFYLPVWHDVDPSSGLARFVIDPEQPVTGSNLTYYYSQARRGTVGKAYPDIMGGFTNLFSFKGFSLNALITYQFGGNMFDYPGYFMKNHGVRYGTWNYSAELAGNYWKNPGDEVKYPRPVMQWSARPDKWSTMHILSTDFIRLKELSLSYSLPSELISKIGLSELALTLNASNVAFLYVAEKNVDPEVSLNGYRTVDTPLARTVSVGVNINF